MTANPSDDSSTDESAFMTDTIPEWRDEAWTFAITLMSPNSIDATGETHTALVTELESLVEAAADASHPSWEPGDRCPECDSSLLNRWMGYPELAHHSDGEHALSESHSHRTVYAWTCSNHDCEAILRLSPAAILLPVAPGELPTEVCDTQGETGSGLQNALDERCPTTEWRTGYACSFCDKPYIHESPLDVYPVDSQNGEYHTESVFPERLQTIGYHCDGCGKCLRQARANVLADKFSLAA